MRSAAPPAPERDDNDIDRAASRARSDARRLRQRDTWLTGQVRGAAGIVDAGGRAALRSPARRAVGR